MCFSWEVFDETRVFLKRECAQMRKVFPPRGKSTCSIHRHNTLESFCCWSLQAYNRVRWKAYLAEVGPLCIITRPKNCLHSSRHLNQSLEGWLLHLAPFAVLCKTIACLRGFAKTGRPSVQPQPWRSRRKKASTPVCEPLIPGAAIKTFPFGGGGDSKSLSTQ